MGKRKICVVTGSRAEYGLLYWVLKELADDSEVELQIIATGMHMSPEFGLTYRAIENDGFVISKKLDILLSSDSAAGITKSIGLANIAFADAFMELRPDLVLLLGDRFEIFAAATAACVARIPIAHCHGGELTFGAIDDAFRHSITKMSHLHFTSTDVYRNRIIQLGEYPDKIFNVGALGIENIRRLPLLSKHSFEESIDFKLKEKNLLITFHPVTLEVGTSEYQIQELLKVLKDLGESGLIFTLPNSDTDSRVVIKKIRQFVKDNPNNSVVFESLGQLRYLSALNFVDAVVGNSSSGIIEAPSFKIATVNIGDRQNGRLKAASVVDCKPYHTDISHSLMKVYSNEFKIMLKSIVNPYDKGDSSKSICSILKNISLSDLLKKEFYDITY